MLDCPPPPLHMEGFRHLSAPVWFCYSSVLSAWQMFAWKFPNQSVLASRCSPCIHRAFYPIAYGEQHCPRSRMKIAMQRGCLCWKVPAWSPCLGTEGWEEGSGGIAGPSASTDWAYLTWLTPKVPPKEPTLLLAGSPRHNQAHKSHFLQHPMHFLNCMLFFYALLPSNTHLAKISG